MSNQQFAYSFSDDDRLRLTNAMFSIALSRLGGMMTITEAEVIESFKRPREIQHNKLDDTTRQVILMPPAPQPEPRNLSEAAQQFMATHPGRTGNRNQGKRPAKKPARKAPAKKAKAKAKKAKR